MSSPTGLVVSATAALLLAGITVPAIGTDAPGAGAVPAGAATAGTDVGPWQVKPPRNGECKWER